MSIGGATKKKGARTGPVTRKVSSDDKHSKPILGGELVDETIRIRSSPYPYASFIIQDGLLMIFEGETIAQILDLAHLFINPYIALGFLSLPVGQRKVCHICFM